MVFVLIVLIVLTGVLSYGESALGRSRLFSVVFSILFFSTAPRSETTETPLQVAAFPPLTPPLNSNLPRQAKEKKGKK